MHFLIQVLLTFLMVSAVMLLMALIRPLAQPRQLPVRQDLALTTESSVKIAGALVILAVVVFFMVFW